VINQEGALQLAADIFGLSQTSFKPEIGEPLERILMSLSTKERLVLTARYGLDDGKPKKLREIALILGVSSREYPRQIQEYGLRRMRHPTRSRYLRDYILDRKERKKKRKRGSWLPEKSRDSASYPGKERG